LKSKSNTQLLVGMITRFTTFVNRALADFTHQVFGAVAAELSNLMNCLIVVRL